MELGEGRGRQWAWEGNGPPIFLTSLRLCIGIPQETDEQVISA